MNAPALKRLSLVALLALGLGLGAACSDDGSDVRNVGESSGSASGSASDSSSGSSASGSTARPTARLGGYEPVSEVASHAAVSRDMAEINGLLEADGLDAAAIETLYAEGKNAVNDDGSVRTLKAFAAGERDEPIWNDYAAFFEDPTWLDTFVTQALEASGPFDGASDDVRRQAVQKGIQNGVMVAYVLHELVAAEQKVAAGETDPAEGAPHHVDEAWAFYHGDDPSAAPFSTAEKRGADFGTGDAVNAAVLAQMTAAQAAARAGDAAALKAANDEITRQILITYIQASLKYAAEAEAALAEGDEAGARAAQAEGLAFYRVIAPLVAGADEAAARRALVAFDLEAGPAVGMGRSVATALESVYDELGITAAEIGTYAS